KVNVPSSLSMPSRNQNIANGMFMVNCALMVMLAPTWLSLLADGGHVVLSVRQVLSWLHVVCEPLLVVKVALILFDGTPVAEFASLVAISSRVIVQLLPPELHVAPCIAAYRAATFTA